MSGDWQQQDTAEDSETLAQVLVEGPPRHRQNEHHEVHSTEYRRAEDSRDTQGGQQDVLACRMKDLVTN